MQGRRTIVREIPAGVLFPESQSTGANEMQSRRVFFAVIAGAVLFSSAELFAKGEKVLRTATLAKTASAPAAAKGKGKFDQSASRTNFSAEAQGLASVNGKSAVFCVDGVVVGTRTIALGVAKLELTNQRGGTVPSVVAGTKLEIKVNNVVILTGTFN